MTVTELPGRTGVLRDNVEANVPDKGVAVRECVWGTVGTTTPWGLVEDLGGGWDLLTGSDLVYSDESTPDLVRPHPHPAAPPRRPPSRRPPPNSPRGGGAVGGKEEKCMEGWIGGGALPRPRRRGGVEVSSVALSRPISPSRDAEQRAGRPDDINTMSFTTLLSAQCAVSRVVKDIV